MAHALIYSGVILTYIEVSEQITNQTLGHLCILWEYNPSNKHTHYNAEIFYQLIKTPGQY